ncbi:ATP-binding protein [Paraburkholderia azotifigens]|uniref:Transcriptional regulator n=1 Tax=Paraburkholderia azotifigens TaxID=2057004 RepID=A0A5C6V6F6_9BURK|nr:winged helix-turn-helix domain-containing protein [Paraburkholderia azotifigens]TXC80036.1 transcriptional regulator [Paraburkholderia azotifigens]
MIHIGPLDIDLARREARVDGKTVRISNRAFDILELLIEAQGGLVSKETILERVWPETVVGDNNLQVHMSALRKLLGESRDLIKTVAGRGYRLVRGASAVRQTGGASASHTERHMAVPHNLPAYSSALVGRDEAIAHVCDALGASRHVTLLGSGGIGKTRVAIEVARRLLEQAPGGVHCVSLSAASDTCSVLAMLASVLGVHPEGRAATRERIVETIGGRRMLIVLDSCEHVVDAAARLAHHLLSACPQLRVLSTSREPLRIPSETLYWVPALDVPEPNDDTPQVLRCSAVNLFLMRARAIDARFAADEPSIHVTGMVCRRLDGIPLAIELAAARAALLGIDTLAAHLDDRFGMLTGGTRTALPRHQTLKATLDWSHALLDDAERKTLRRIGVFADRFPLEAAIAVAADNITRELDVVAAMAALVEKSLVVASTEPGHAAFRLLETTRMYALQKLDDNGEHRMVALHHARYLSALIDGDAAGKSAGESWRSRMPELLDEVRAALTWVLSDDGDEALRETLPVHAVFLFYELSLIDECCAWARRALAALAPARGSSHASSRMRARLRLLAALGASLVLVHGPSAETHAIWKEVLASAIASGDEAFEARALWGMWNACQTSGSVHDALEYARRYTAFVDGVADVRGAILGYRLMGVAAHYAGDQRCARLSFEQLLEVADGLRTRMPSGHFADQVLVSRASLARVLWLQGLREQALALAEDAVIEACSKDQAMIVCYTLAESLVPLALLSGKRDCARRAIAVLCDVSARARLTLWQAAARCFDACRRSLDDVSAQSLDSFRAALGELDALKFGAPFAMLAAQYAVALMRAGRRDEAQQVVDSALARCDLAGDYWLIAELRRLRGELLLADGAAIDSHSDAARDAETWFVAALEEASAQGARSLQLRAATSLARLWHRLGRETEAAQLLQSACANVCEGRDLDDFKAAGQLLMQVKGLTQKPAGASGERRRADTATRLLSFTPPHKYA